MLIQAGRLQRSYIIILQGSPGFQHRNHITSWQVPVTITVITFLTPRMKSTAPGFILESAGRLTSRKRWDSHLMQDCSFPFQCMKIMSLTNSGCSCQATSATFSDCNPEAWLIVAAVSKKNPYKISFLKSSSSQRLLKSSSLGAHALSCGLNEIALFRSARAFALSPMRQ